MAKFGQKYTLYKTFLVLFKLKFRYFYSKIKSFGVFTFKWICFEHFRSRCFSHRGFWTFCKIIYLFKNCMKTVKPPKRKSDAILTLRNIKYYIWKLDANRVKGFWVMIGQTETNLVFIKVKFLFCKYLSRCQLKSHSGDKPILFYNK